MYWWQELKRLKMDNVVKYLIFFIMLITLNACAAPYTGNMEYSLNDSRISRASSDKQIIVSTFKDLRDDYPEVKFRIGKLAGTYGETLQAIEIQQPLDVTVSDIVCDFLNNVGCNAGRTEQASPSGYTLSGDITDFYCYSVWATHKATIKIDLTLTDNKTGEEVWKGTIHNHYAGNIFNKYPEVRNDPEVDCVGYSCHSKGINLAMNLMFSEAMLKTWEEGLRETLTEL